MTKNHKAKICFYCGFIAKCISPEFCKCNTCNNYYKQLRDIDIARLLKKDRRTIYRYKEQGILKNKVEEFFKINNIPYIIQGGLIYAKTNFNGATHN